MEKGIIAAPARSYGEDTVIRADNALTLQDLRYFLLYWDKVVIPTTNLVHFAIPEEEELLSTGIITRPRIPFSGTFDSAAARDAQFFAQATIAQQLIANDTETDWILHQIGNQIIIPDDASITKQSVKINLVNALPVPFSDVAIPDILEFKERRKDELSQLHQSIDDLYFEVLQSPDASLKSKILASEFRKSIEQINQVAIEKWKKTSKFDFSTELNIDGKNITSGAAAGAIFDFYTNLYTIPIGTIVGATASLLKIKAKSTKSLEPSKDKQILSYIAKAHEENILKTRKKGKKKKQKSYFGSRKSRRT